MLKCLSGSIAIRVLEGIGTRTRLGMVLVKFETEKIFGKLPTKNCTLKRIRPKTENENRTKHDVKTES